MTKTTKSLTSDDLRQFTGTETWHRHAFMRKVLYSDGAKYVAEKGGAYWLLDDIAFAQRDHQAHRRRDVPALEAPGASRP